MENIELIGTGPQLGVRETRRVKGIYARIVQGNCFVESSDADSTRAARGK